MLDVLVFILSHFNRYKFFKESIFCQCIPEVFTEQLSYFTQCGNKTNN